MRLKRLKIEGYRSLKSVEWEPASLNVLIGANASGKSNFLQALELLPAAANGELAETILSRGGMAPLLWDGQAHELGFEAQLFEENTPDTTYFLELRRLGASGFFEISREELAHAGTSLLLDPGEGAERREAGISQRLPRDRPGAIAAQKGFRNWSVYQDLRVDQRATVRESAVTRMETRLAADGHNLIPVLHTLYESSPEFEEAVDDAMLAAFYHDYGKLKFTPMEDGRVQLRLRWKNGRRLHTAADLSDGTLRFLMLLAILANPSPAPLIAIDEPDLGLHPDMLSILAELAVEASRRSQVILTTHSPEFLDAFRETLPATTVFSWVDDHTEARTLKGDKLKGWIEDYSLGRFCFSGEAEALS